MNDREDVLKRASSALRDAGTPSRDELERLRARLLGGGNVVHLPQARRRARLHWVLPLVAALLTATAFAATPAAWESVVAAAERFLPFAARAGETRKPARQAPRGPETAQPSALARARTESEAAPAFDPRAPAPSLLPPALAAAPTGHAEHAPARSPWVKRTRPPGGRPVPSVPTPAVAETAPTPAPRASPSREVQAFRTAYALQLRERDPLRALQAWDALLEGEPSTSLAMEARFNRALCLVQLGRREAARAALASFATGQETHGYRRREALALLRNFEGSP